MKACVYSFVAFILCSLGAWAQESESAFIGRYNDYASQLSPEKLYLHTDREVYCVGDTLWFRGYLKNASASSEYAESNYIYVELIAALSEMDAVSGTFNESDRVRRRVKIKRSEGGFDGYVVIPDKLSTGRATLRAYTWWMRNKGTTWMFTKELEIINPVKSDYLDKLVREKQRDDYVYEEMGVTNPYRKQKVKANDIDIQFLPESGSYSAGQPSVFGIRSIADDGKGIPVTGEILSSGRVLGTFSTDSHGLGKVSLAVPVDAKSLVVKLHGVSKSYEFPKPADGVCTISVTLSESMVTISSSGVVSGKILVVCDRSGVEYYLKLEGPRTFEIPVSELACGINNAYLVDEMGQIYAERDFFIYPEESISASLEDATGKLGKREKVDETFMLTGPDGQPLSGEFSVSVSDSRWFPVSGNQYDIVSWMWLGSEMESFVEEPGRLFDRERSLSDRIAEMDMVMLTYGWKYYDVMTDQDTPEFGREYSQSISGRVTRLFNINARNSLIAFVAPRINLSTYADLKPTGYFIMEGLDFPENTQFLISTANREGEASRMPVVNEETFPAVSVAPKIIKPVEFTSVNEEIEFKKRAYPDVYGLGADPEYMIKPSRIIGEAKPIINGLNPFPLFEFKPGQLKLYEEIQSYDSFTLGDYILNKIPGAFKYQINRGPERIYYRVGFESTKMKFAKTYRTIKIFINGMEVMGEDMWMVWSTTIQDVDAIAILTGMDAAKFQTNAELKPVPVVLVKAKDLIRAPFNVTSTRPLGWQKPAKRYEPKYDNEAAKKAYEPMRGTVYWNPCLKVADGRADFEFWSSDHEVPYTVIIEGMTSDGIPVTYRTFINQ
ncbi:MAG: hypothetical protein MJZ09_01370 [Bacteroidales bacterium]|nr:hypothetical protein [Bacteroidales bacterium]